MRLPFSLGTRSLRRRLRSLGALLGSGLASHLQHLWAMAVSPSSRGHLPLSVSPGTPVMDLGPPCLICPEILSLMTPQNALFPNKLTAQVPSKEAPARRRAA